MVEEAPQFAGQHPEIVAIAQDLAPHAVGAVARLDLIAQSPFVRNDTFEAFPHNEFHDDKPPLTEKETEQAKAVGSYIAMAHEQLPSDATEEQVWDRVFELQIQEFTELAGREDVTDAAERTALSIMVGNLLATSHLDNESRQNILERRMWRIAQTRHGRSFVSAAQKNIDFCVSDQYPADKGDRKPAKYTSVRGQVLNFENLFSVTDENAKDDTYSRIRALKSATSQEAEWFFDLVNSSGRRDLIASNFRELSDQQKREMALFLVSKGWPAGNFVKAEKAHGDLNGGLEPEEVIRMEMAGDRPETACYYLKYVEPDKLEGVIREVLQSTNKEAVAVILGEIPYDQVGILDASLMRDFLDRGVELKISHFKNIQPSDIDWLFTREEVSDFDIVYNAKYYSAESQLFVVQRLLSFKPPNTHLLDSQVNEFVGITKEHMLEMILAADPSFGINLDNGQKWIPEYDEAWIGSLLERFSGDSNSLHYIVYQGLTACRQSPEGTKWLLSRIESQGLSGILYSNINIFAPYMTQDQQQRLFDHFYARDHEGYIDTSKMAYFDKLDKTVMVEQLLGNGHYQAIIRNLGVFAEAVDSNQLLERLLNIPTALFWLASDDSLLETIGFRRVFDRLVETGQEDLILKKAYVYVNEGIVSVEDIFAMAMRIDGLGDLLYSVNNRDLVSTYGVERLFFEIQARGELGTIARFIYDLVEDQEKKIQIINAVIEEGDIYSVREIIIKNGVESLPLSLEEIRQKLISAGYAEKVFENPSVFFDGKDGYLDWKPEASIEELIEKGAAAALLVNTSSRFSSEMLRQLLSRTIQDGYVDFAARNFSRYSYQLGRTELDPEIATAFAEQGHLGILMKYQTLLGKPSEQSVEAAFRSENSRAYEYYSFYVNSTGQKINWLERSLAILSSESPTGVISAAKDILEQKAEQLPSFLIEIGVTKRGEPGLHQLRAAIPKIRSVFLSILDSGGDEHSLRLLRDNPVARSFGKQIVRFSEAEFGKRDQGEWTRILDSAIESIGLNGSLPEGFVSSDIFSIRTRDRAKVEQIQIRKDVAEQYTKFQEDIDYVLGLIDGNMGRGVGASGAIAAEVVAMVEQSREELIKHIELATNDKAKNHLVDRLGGVSEFLDSSNPEDPLVILGSMGVLAGIKVTMPGQDEKVTIDSLLRRLAIALVSERDTSAVIHNARTLRAGKLDIDNVSFMQEFIDDNVVRRVDGLLAGKTEAQKAVTKLLSTVSFSEQVKELKRLGFDSMSTLQLVPTRGLMLELSGQFSDACWASTYDSIAKQFPNISALVMVRNRGESTERIVGSSLLINTVDQNTGEEVLVVRGVNPIQNYVTDIDMQDFTGQLIQHVRSIAGSRRVAMVLDGYSGGALSNRPALHAYIVQAFADAKLTTPLLLDESTTFNGYKLDPNGKYPVYYV